MNLSVHSLEEDENSKIVLHLWTPLISTLKKPTAPPKSGVGSVLRPITLYTSGALGLLGKGLSKIGDENSKIVLHRNLY